MTLPGTTVISRESPPSAAARIEAGTWFVTGFAERGEHTEPVLVKNLAQFTEEFGERVSYSMLYDALDVFFREGGYQAYVSRVVGNSPTKAAVTLDNASSDPTLTVTAKSAGAWGADVDVTITGSGPFTITVIDDSVTVETSPSLADNEEAVAWAASSNYIRLTDLGEGIPDEGTFSLTGGDDGHSGATETNWEEALTRIPKDLGPGQVSAPGRTTAQSHQDILEHCAARNRVGILDLADSADEATLVAAAATDRALTEARYGTTFAPWAVVPGIASGTTRTVPYSAVQAGLCARLDALGNSPNVPAAGEQGVSRYAIGLSQVAWTDAERETLNDGGVNVVRSIKGSIRTYGYRTIVDPLGDAAAWLNFGNARLAMIIGAKGEDIAERFLFSQLDGRGLKIAEFNGELKGMLIPYYDQGSLYGVKPSDAFVVDTGDQVNTPESLADGELRAVIAVRMSPYAERVIIEVVKVAITEVLA